MILVYSVLEDESRSDETAHTQMFEDLKISRSLLKRRRRKPLEDPGATEQTQSGRQRKKPPYQKADRNVHIIDLTSETNE